MALPLRSLDLEGEEYTPTYQGYINARVAHDRYEDTVIRDIGDLNRRLWELERQVLPVFDREPRREIRSRSPRRECERYNAQAVVDDLESDTPLKTEAPIVEKIVPDARSQVMRVEWSQFQSLRGLEEGSCAAIDVLTGEPDIQLDLYYLKSYGRKTELQAPEKRSIAKSDVVPGEIQMPERLRINSRHLLQILSQISRPDDSPLKPPVVLLRPFRVLAYFNEAIRKRYEKLGKRLKVEVHQVNASNSFSALLDNAAGEGSIGPELPRKEEISNENEGQVQEIDMDSEKEDELDPESPVAFEHLRCLVDFMDKDIQKRKFHLKSGKCKKVFFSDLWHLFHPGDLVIGSDGKQAYRVMTMNSVGHRVIDPMRKYYRLYSWKGEKEEKEEEEEASITIRCIHIDFDGKHLGPVSKVFRIPKFEREIAVTSLNVYPLHFHPFAKEKAFNDTNVIGSEFKKYLIRRGRWFLKAVAIQQTTVQPMYYAGPALQTLDEIESQVVVDFEAAFGVEDHIKNGWKPELETLIRSEDSEDKNKGGQKCGANCCRGESVHDDSYIEKKMNDEFMGTLLPKAREEVPSVVVLPRPLDTKEPETGLSEDDLAIMSYRVFGYVLRNRKWAQLDITYLSEYQQLKAESENEKNVGEGAEEPKSAFDQLVLPTGHKDMILSLITQHFRDKESILDQRTDVVRGKGKGLIILLHGAPGVGKTTTAEGVAERFNKPLFQLTCGDLGTTAKDVEAALESNFALASRWGCVLLLDEADVFLAQRTKEDFKRNGLVAVFLRVLEYYAGILFLTTNRVGDFDEAFASRIHISLYYPELGREQTLEVFKLNLQLMQDRFRRKPRKLIFDEMKIGLFASDYWDKHPFDHWSGRQIRNACQTAVALAEFEMLGENGITSTGADVHLEVSHFETVAKAYLAFSEHIKDIYGTHAARRAKEAGLRAMWVNEKGDLIGSVGPKEAGMLKPNRKSRYIQKSQGQYNAGIYAQQQQQEQQQPMAPNSQGLPYRESRGEGQGYMNHPPPAPLRQSHPAGASEKHYDDAHAPQQPSNVDPQLQRQWMAPQHAQGQGWGGYHSDYDNLRPPSAGARGAYPQDRYNLEAGHPHQAKGGPSQIQRPPAGNYSTGYDRPGPEAEIFEASEGIGLASTRIG
ncbi:hypothetical protein SAMD00023353_2200320 [Rosellinia necatrix]|uniref:AAA+ ATPase domain-containing protein n=1 Tax=Rosellinia necatrix TaxID=77044 RepID=A0A1S7UUB1_ROSNE|nr:hypothetical protein SAMD00023353_2200320 [Rosellinia necatrix]